MLDDGEKLVPGFRQARALRVWTGVRPLFEDAKAADTDYARRDARPRAARPRGARRRAGGSSTITGGKLTTFRLMAEETIERSVAKHLGEQRPCTTATEPLPGSESGATISSASGCSRKEAHAARRAADLRVRAGAAVQARAGDRAPGHDQPRRHPPAAASGDGAVPGRFLHLPRDRHSARARRAHGRAGRRVAAATSCEERWKGVWPVLYGDQLRQARLDDWIFQGVLDVEHLPVRREAVA